MGNNKKRKSILDSTDRQLQWLDEDPQEAALHKEVLPSGAASEPPKNPDKRRKDMTLIQDNRYYRMYQHIAMFDSYYFSIKSQFSNVIFGPYSSLVLARTVVNRMLLEHRLFDPDDLRNVVVVDFVAKKRIQ